jgi:hypothetical protein
VSVPAFFPLFAFVVGIGPPFSDRDFELQKETGNEEG